MKKKILIVDEEIALVGALVTRFMSEGFITLSAANGQDGLKSALKHHPDIILLDIMMPVMDGATMLKKLRADKWGQDVHVILLTNLTDSEKLDESMHQGACDYLVKCDMTIEDVVNKVKGKLKIE